MKIAKTIIGSALVSVVALATVTFAETAGTATPEDLI